MAGQAWQGRPWHGKAGRVRHRVDGLGMAGHGRLVKQEGFAPHTPIAIPLQIV